jgi:hypothetical protein
MATGLTRLRTSITRFGCKAVWRENWIPLRNEGEKGASGGPVRTRTGTAGLGNQSSVLLSYGAAFFHICFEVPRCARDFGSGLRRPLTASI